MKKKLPPNLQKIQTQLDKISAQFRQYMAEKRYPEAAAEAYKAHKLIPKSVVPLSDAATAAVKGSMWQDAVTFAKKALQRDSNHINSLDALSHAYDGLQDWENCRIYGLKALQLRDSNNQAKHSQPILPDIKIQENGKKIIAFSLFGSSSAYIEPAVLNTEIAKTIYPGWTCRFYIDDSVPEQAVQRLRNNGAEIVKVSEQQKNWPGTMWRFLAINDNEASRVIFRDADSVISEREASAVAEWEKSGKLFHTIRDAGTHTELILAGLWGAVTQAVPDMEQKIQQYLQSPLESRHFADQFFLRDNIWQYVHQSLYATDRIFGFYDAQDFPDTRMTDYRNNHVGCDEGNSHFAAAYNLPDGSLVTWTLYSKIAPQLNPDASVNVLPEERIICTYQTTVQNGKVSGYIPRRYSKGFANGNSRMVVQAVK